MMKRKDTGSFFQFREKGTPPCFYREAQQRAAPSRESEHARIWAVRPCPAGARWCRAPRVLLGGMGPRDVKHVAVAPPKRGGGAGQWVPGRFGGKWKVAPALAVTRVRIARRYLSLLRMRALEGVEIEIEIEIEMQLSLNFSAGPSFNYFRILFSIENG
ncbi:hypothetical protein NL676_015376 [Syzygium grande]|nr:hypothetical protein NL676_015376 [Syzygium grande]